MWTDSPEPLQALVEHVTGAKSSGDAAEIAMVVWACLAVIPRGVLHLASWVLAHPLRLLAAAVVVAVFLLTV